MPTSQTFQDSNSGTCSLLHMQELYQNCSQNCKWNCKQKSQNVLI